MATSRLQGQMKTRMNRCIELETLVRNGHDWPLLACGRILLDTDHLANVVRPSAADLMDHASSIPLEPLDISMQMSLLMYGWRMTLLMCNKWIFKEHVILNSHLPMCSAFTMYISLIHDFKVISVQAFKINQCLE